MALVVAENALFARPDDAHRPFDALLLQLLHGQRQHDLDRHVLPAAKRTADGHVLHAHAVRRQVERVGDLLLLLVRPLPADVDGDPAVRVNPAHARLRLQVGMFLVRQAVFALDDDVGRIPTGRHVPFANLVMLEDVGAVPRLHQNLVPHRFVDVGHGRQWLPVNRNQRSGALGLRLALGHDHGHVIALPAADVAVGLGAAEPDHHGLVGQDQAVFVDRHVGGRVDGDDAGGGQRFADVHRQHAGVGLVAKHNFGVQQVFGRHVARVRRGAGHFAGGIDAG